MPPAEVAVAICTFNPDERLLRRTLESVAAQTLRSFECVIVDNNSDRPVAKLAAVREFLGRVPTARVVEERTPGLSFARSAAITATSSPLVCFVDDDNEPEPGYLAEAVRILHEHAGIGALGPGNVEVDFVDPVPEWFAERFRPHFQQKDLEGGVVTGRVEAGWTEYYPPGSCMVVRREVLERYRARFLAGELWASDRVGASLSSGGDTQIVWEAVSMGLEAGIAAPLRIRHLIPAKRSTLRYMERLAYGTSSSYLPALVSSFPAERAKLSPPPRTARILIEVLRITRAHAVRNRRYLRFELAAYFGRLTGLARATGTRRRFVEFAARLLGIIGK